MAKSRIFRASPIKLSADGELPTRIMLMQSGSWPNSVKGNFSISADDLREIKDNFDKGIGFPTDDASTGLAIDFKHEYADEAGAWIKGLELAIDSATGEGKLYANPIEWTDSGEAAVRGGRFKCISPSGYFGTKNGAYMSAWSNPTDLKDKVKNVLDGAGLTNIPFLRGMSPVRASATQDDDIDNDIEYDKVIFVSDSQHNKENPMTIDALRVKDKDQLSADEMKFMTDHKSELSADEMKKFGFENDDQRVNLSTEDKETLDAIKSGKKKLVDSEATVVGKEQLDSLMRTQQDYKEERVKTTLDKHVSRGAIKQDAAKMDGFWAKQLLDATTDEQRKAVEDTLEGLPANEQLAKEIGSGEDAAAGTTAREQLASIAAKKVAEAEAAGKSLLMGDALKLAGRENQDLLQQDLMEMKAGK